MADGYRHASPFLWGLAGVFNDPAPVGGFNSPFPFYGGMQGTGGGAPPCPTVLIFNGVSTADGVTHFQGISRPTILLTPCAAPGTYDVNKTYGVSGKLRPDAVIRETYLIDGELP